MGRNWGWFWSLTPLLAAGWLATSGVASAQNAACNDPERACAGNVSSQCRASMLGVSRLDQLSRACQQQVLQFQQCVADTTDRCGGGATGRASSIPGHRIVAEAQHAGSEYLLVRAPGPLGWVEAQEAAQQFGGNLASIGDADENAAVFDLLQDGSSVFQNRRILFVTASVGPWIGGYQRRGSPEPAGGWTWADGTAVRYQNWRSGEPNDMMGEQFMVIYCAPNRICSTWNDTNGLSFPVISYLVERRP